MIGKGIAALALTAAAVSASAVPASAGGGYFGNPTSADRFYQVQTGPDCVEQSVRKAVDVVEGRAVVSESAIDSKAAALGFFVPGAGTLPGSDWPSLIALYGAHYAGPSGMSRARLEANLAAGRAVIVLVNGESIWAPARRSSGLADHAVVVEAVSKSSGTVVLSDGGDPNGENERVPWSTFSRAWSASSYSAVAVWR